MAKEYTDPGPRPEGVTPKELEKWRRDTENFLMEGARKLPAPGSVKVDATDSRLKALRRDHIKFLERHNPMTDALWLALLRDEADVLFDEEMTRRYMVSLATGNGVVDAPHVPAIVAIANKLVAGALKGDAASFQQIADRIEGKPGLRIDDVDPDDPVRRRQTTEIVERAIRAITDGRIREKQDATIDVEAKLVQLPEKETE